MRAQRKVSFGWLLITLLVVSGCDDGAGTTPMDVGVDSGQGGGGGPGGTGGGGTGGMEEEDVGVEPCPCPGNQTCEGEDDTCTEPAMCMGDVDCLDDRVCTDGACETPCGNDDECADGRCLEGECVECIEPTDCSDGQLCEENICVNSEGCNAAADCEDGRVCTGDECVAGFDCEDAGCPEGLTCQDGGCIASGPNQVCRDDSCLFGEVCRDDQPRRCGPCASDDDCPGQQACDLDPAGSRCVETTCAEDTDCIGGRTCGDAGRCEVPECTDDDGEPNNDFGDATLIDLGQTRPGLVSCDDDWYVFDLPAETVAIASIRQLDRGADLDLLAYNADQREIGAARSGRDQEAVVLGPYRSARPVYLRVVQSGPESVAAYDLQIEPGAPNVCVDDGLDVGVGDDTAETARSVRRANDPGFDDNLDGNICPDDDDYICFNMAAGETLTISAELTTGNTVLIGDLYRGDNVVESGRWPRGEEGENIEIRAIRGNYCLRLHAESGSGRYQILLSAVSAEAQELCDEAEVLTLESGSGAVEASLPTDADDSLSPQCSPDRADGPELAYTVTIDAPSLLIARVTGMAGGTLGDPVVSIRSTCEITDAEIGCATGSVEPENPLLAVASPAEIRVPVTEAGDYFIIVDGRRVGESPDFQLEVEARPLAAVPRNNTCEEAMDVAFDGEGNAVIGLSLDRASDNGEACIGANAPDAFYHIELDEPGHLRVQVAAASDDFAVGAYLGTGCEAASPLICGIGVDEFLEAGSYILAVDGISTHSRGRVEVQINFEPAGDVPGNEVCADAQALGAGGSIEGSTAAAADDYRLAQDNRCTDSNSLGGDVVYSLDVEAGTQYFVQGVPLGGWDLSLYVVSDCNDPAAACIGGSDGALTETVVFEAPADGELFVIIDGSSEERGDFTLRWGVAECTEDADCDGVCANFRCE